VDRYGNGNIR